MSTLSAKSSAASLGEGDNKDARIVFIRTMEPIRGKRVLAIRKSRNPLARVAGLGSKTKKFYLETKLETGYCVLAAYKDAERPPFGSVVPEPIEEYRFMGGNITVDLITVWPEELNMTDPMYRACLILKGQDLKREDGRAIVGELYLFAKDSGVIMQIRQAMIALANAARPPDASCVFGKIGAEALQLSKSLDSRSANFKLDREASLQIQRACARLSSVNSVIPGIFGDAAMKVDAKASLELLKTPPGMTSDGSPTELADGSSSIEMAMAARGLLETLQGLKTKPISAALFLLYSGHAEKCRIRFEQAHPSGEASIGQLPESEEFAFTVVNLFRDLSSPDAVFVLKEITRVVKRLAFEIRGKVTLLECVESLGPHLVESYKQTEAREMSWLMASCCSKHRDKIFAKAATSSQQSSLSPTSILRASSTRATPLKSLNHVMSSDTSEKSQISDSSSSSPRSVSQTADAVLPSSPPQAKPSFAHDGPAKKDGDDEISMVMSNGKRTEMESQTQPVDDDNDTPAFMAKVDLTDFDNVQEEIDSLTRLHEYLKQRMRDEPNHPNSQLWKRELDACQSELNALGPTMFFVASRKELVPSFGNSTRSITNEEEAGGDGGYTSFQEQSQQKQPEQQGFIERALSLLVESRKEPLSGTKEQLYESTLILKNALQDVRSLNDNVGEFLDVANGTQQTRQFALALVGMLEENISLRLRLISKMDEDHQITNISTVSNNSSMQDVPLVDKSIVDQDESKSTTVAAASQKAATKVEDAVAVDEEEYEI